MNPYFVNKSALEKESEREKEKDCNFPVVHWIKKMMKNYIPKGIRQNINKALPVTDWPSEWQIENATNVSIEIFLITLGKFYSLFFDDIWRNKRFVSE